MVCLGELRQPPLEQHSGVRQGAAAAFTALFQFSLVGTEAGGWGVTVEKQQSVDLCLLRLRILILGD